MAPSGFMVTRRRLPCVMPSPSAEWSRSVAPMCESSVSACVMTMLSAGSRASVAGNAPGGHGLRCAYAIFHFHSHISQTKIFIYEIDCHYTHVVSGRSDSLCAGNYPQTGSNQTQANSKETPESRQKCRKAQACPSEEGRPHQLAGRASALPPQETHGRYGAGRGRYVYDG